MFGRWRAFIALIISAVVVLAGWRAGEAMADAPASQPASQPAGPTEAQIRVMVRRCGHPVHARRRAAIRQLAEWGPVVFPELRRVAASDDMEAALSARELLDELQTVVLIGARVTLEVDRPRIAWDEPVMLTVRAFNPTGERIEAPWPAGADTQPADSDPWQVAAIMDAGDFLTVTGPDGQQIDLRVEPIERDKQVYEAVNSRARGKSPSHPLASKSSDRLVIARLNRGWARYPMLTAGRYTIAFRYQPQWKDSSWTREGFGLVRSEPVTVEVTQAAPESIRTADNALQLNVRREGEYLLAELESTWDYGQWINLNIGDDLRTHARLEWRLDGQAHSDDEEPVTWTPESTGAKYSAERVRVLGPGEKLEIGRVSAAVLREQLNKRGKPPGPAKVVARYMSLATPAQIKEVAAGKVREVKVPTHLYSGTVNSEPVALENPRK